MVPYVFSIYLQPDTENNEDDVIQSCEQVDIIITTHGKLVEHIKNNPNFDIQDLQYLVVDEADKLLLQSYDNWIQVVEINDPRDS